jgi:hypothetical protein
MVKYCVKEFPTAKPEHRYRYSIIRGKDTSDSEGYPTASHVFRAVNGIHQGFCKMVDPEHKLQWPLPKFTKDSLLPKPRKVAVAA